MKYYRYVTTGMASVSPEQVVTEEELRAKVQAFPGEHMPYVEVIPPNGPWRLATAENIDTICSECAAMEKF